MSDETGWLIEEHFGGHIHYIKATDEPWPRYTTEPIYTSEFYETRRAKYGKRGHR